MSAKQANKKLPVTIAVVTVLLVGVVVLNLRTFGAVAHRSAPEYRLQASPPVPDDVAQMVRSAVEVKESTIATGGGVILATSDRDPFYPERAQPKPVKKVGPQKNHSRVKSGRRIKALECSAIMLGGQRPMAIINGQGHYPGDKIRGLVLEEIDPDGVTFRQADGKAKRLKIGMKENENQMYRVITRVMENEDQGHTSLVSQ